MESDLAVRLVLPTRAHMTRLATVLRDAASREPSAQQAQLWNHLAQTCDARVTPRKRARPKAYKRRANRGEDDIHEDKIDAVVRGGCPPYAQLSLVETFIAIERMMDKDISSRRMAIRLNTSRRNIDRYRQALRERKESEKSPV